MRVSGIYKIQSTIKHERIYIGSAIYIKSRWAMHRYQLRNNKHSSQKLQRHYNKYSESGKKAWIQRKLNKIVV